MNITKLNDRSAVPWWAAFGAPLVGVPLLVGLLAFGTAGQRGSGVADDAGTTYPTERAEALRAEIDRPPVSLPEVAGSQS